MAVSLSDRGVGGPRQTLSAEKICINQSEARGGDLEDEVVL